MYVCPYCGSEYEDYYDLYNIHIPLCHREEFENSRAEVEDVFIADDIEKTLKAKKYDEITDALFMAMGIIEDGDSIKYLIEPEEIIEKLIKIITEDNFSEKFIDGKRKYIQKNRSF